MPSKSQVEPLPTQIRTAVVNEISNVCFVVMFSVDYADWAAALISPLEKILVLTELAEFIDSAKNSIETIQEIWPAGKSAVVNLKNISDILPVWLLNFREWQQIIKKLGEGKLDSRAEKTKYESCVMKNREYLAKLDSEFAQAAALFSGVNVDFTEMVIENRKKINSLEVTDRARARVTALLDEIWQSGRMSRAQVHENLAGHLGLSSQEFKITTLELGQCALALSWGKLAKLGLSHLAD